MPSSLVPPMLAPARRAERVDAGACFASPAGGEIMVRGRKLVGSAQLREGDGLLQHGSILLAGRQGLVGEISRGAAPPDLAGPLTEASSDTSHPREVAEAVAAAASERWGGIWERSTCADLLAEAAGHEPRFRSPAWTWQA